MASSVIANLPTLAQEQARRRAVQKHNIVPKMLAKEEKDKQRPCVGCKRLFLPRRGHIRACSVRCSRAASMLAKRQPRPCPTCQVAYVPKRQRGGTWAKFCSHRCALVSKQPQMIEVTCAQCARMFSRRDTKHVRRYRVHFCNIVCRGKFVKGPNHALYRGDCDPNRGRAWTRLAESIRSRDGHVCQRCGRTQEENGQRLSVDHIRPWRSFSDKAIANEPSNLTSLCRSCHAQKTAAAERLWLKGDVLALQQYERAVKLPSAIWRDKDGKEVKRRIG